MVGDELKQYLVRTVLPAVQTPAQYVGGELHAVHKDHAQVRGKLCLAFPDLYTIGMSHHGLQVLYGLMNARRDWVCERVFAPWLDMEQALRAHRLPLYSLESFTPLRQFDVIGFSLQYELCVANVLTMLDLAGIPLRACDRTLADPLILAGGPCVQNPEPLAAFVDVFVIGDGEPSLPQVCDLWLAGREAAAGAGQGRGGAGDRAARLLEVARSLPFCYVPSCYAPRYADGRFVALEPRHPAVPASIEPARLDDLDASPLPTRPVVPYVECVHDRIALEIMRGCPGQCRFCQSSVIKRPVRFRSVDTLVRAARESYDQTGYNEISLLSLSTSDYPHFDELVRRLQAEFAPRHVNISVPSLRVNEQLRDVAALIGNQRRSALTLAPEVARDDMRAQICKQIRNEDLYEGCRQAFRQDYESVKLYCMCGLPGERPCDLDGIVEMAETIARIGREERGRLAHVTASVANFIPKPQTPFQWHAMATRAYLHSAQQHLRRRKALRCVQIKCHNIDTSLLEGVLCRGDRRVGEAIELAWRRGARMDSWSEQCDPQRWWQALQDAGIDVDAVLHQPHDIAAPLPWDHVQVRQGRTFLAEQHLRAAAQQRALQAAPAPP